MAPFDESFFEELEDLKSRYARLQVIAFPDRFSPPPLRSLARSLNIPSLTTPSLIPPSLLLLLFTHPS